MTYSALDEPRSSRNKYTDPPPLFQVVSGSVVPKVQPFLNRLRDVYRGQSSPDGQLRQANFLKRVLTIPTLLIILWAWTIWRGERSVFQSGLAECQWHKWERWVDISMLYPKAAG
jgi:hypothetical protein